MSEKLKVRVVGSGYVGMSLSVLLAQHNDFTVLDIDRHRVDQVNRRESTFADSDIEAFLSERELSLTAARDKQAAYAGANFVVVATPANYDPTYEGDTFFNSNVLRSFSEFKEQADVIISNRLHKDLSDVAGKAFTRDLYGCD